MATATEQPAAAGGDLSYWAFVTSLVGGVLIVAGALVGGFAMMFFMPFGMGMMEPGPGVPSAGWFVGWAAWMMAWGILTGAVVLVGAFQVRRGGDRLMPWGIAILVAGALSFFGMGGFMLGGLLAVVGGVLAIVAARPSSGAARRSERGA